MQGSGRRREPGKFRDTFPCLGLQIGGVVERYKGRAGNFAGQNV